MIPNNKQGYGYVLTLDGFCECVKHPVTDPSLYNPLPGGSYGSFVEKDLKMVHDYIAHPPSKWAADRGATHSLIIYKEQMTDHAGRMIGAATRPAIVKKTVAYIGVDEDESGDIVWEKWAINHKWTYVPAGGLK
jgi:hypothetical protein